MSEPTKIVAFRPRSGVPLRVLPHFSVDTFPRFRREWDRPVLPLAAAPLELVPQTK